MQLPSLEHNSQKGWQTLCWSHAQVLKDGNKVQDALPQHPLKKLPLSEASTQAELLGKDAAPQVSSCQECLGPLLRAGASKGDVPAHRKHVLMEELSPIWAARRGQWTGKMKDWWHLHQGLAEKRAYTPICTEDGSLEWWMETNNVGKIRGLIFLLQENTGSFSTCCCRQGAGSSEGRIRVTWTSHPQWKEAVIVFRDSLQQWMEPRLHLPTLLAVWGGLSETFWQAESSSLPSWETSISTHEPIFPYP